MMGDDIVRREMQRDLKRWTGFAHATFEKCPGQAIELMHAACFAAMQHQRDRALPYVRAACAIIELGDQRLQAADGPCDNLPPDLDLREWRTLYLQVDGARRFLESDGRTVTRPERCDGVSEKV